MGGPVVGPAGAPISRRTRGWVRLGVGLALASAGGAVAILGILDTMGSADRAREDAVAQGEIRGVGPTETSSFTAPGGGSQPYTVYVLAGGGNDEDREREATTTTCSVSFADGGGAELDGARQSTNVEVGDLRTVGSFRAPEGRVEVACGWDPPSRFDRGRRGSMAYLVTPGRPGDLARGIIGIVGGVVAALAGIGLAIWGGIGRRVLA